MNTWAFPSIIIAGESFRVYTELQEEFFLPSDDAAEVNYTIASPDSSGETAFQISFQNRHDPTGFDITWGDIPVQDYKPGDKANLGFEHDSEKDVQLVISGDGKGVPYATQYPYLNWMTVSMPTIGCQPLRQICIPGSHDAGMSEWNPHTSGAEQINIQTQQLDILGQLNAGVRWFDIRPVLAGGIFRTGHYSAVGPQMQGGDGQKISDIIEEVNNFTAPDGMNELIVLSLSSSMDTDTGTKRFPAFSRSQYTALLQAFLGLNHRYVAPSGTTDLTTIPLSDIIGKAPAILIIVNENGVDLSPFSNMGIYPAKVFPVYNSYANVDDVATMSADQLGKMKTNRTSPSDKMFTLSWTLTQQGTDVGVVWRSILDLADWAYKALYRELWGGDLSSNSYPNIIEVDDVRADGGVTALAMAINSYLSPGCPGE